MSERLPESDLLTIHDQKLYRRTHKTWEMYCRERLGISPDKAYRQLELARARKAGLDVSSQRGAVKARKLGHVTRTGTRESLVYYARLVGGNIKIGMSIDVPSRMEALARSLGPVELLATEPGGLDIEAKRHRQFDWLAVGSEVFLPGVDLLGHIKRVKAAQ
jgi:hypothetical protein